MAQNHPVYVFDQDCRDFSTTGLVGDLRPIEAIFTEEKNGESQVVIKLTYDQYERWKKAKVGNILKVEVPVRVPPTIRDDQYANTVKIANAQ